MAIQVDWLPEQGPPDPIFFGYELDFNHNKMFVSAGLGSTQVESPPSPDFSPTSAGTTALHVARQGPGHLGVAWSDLPHGITIWGDRNLTSMAGGTQLLSADLVSLTVDTDGPRVYTPAAQAETGAGGSAAALPSLLNLRLITPTNIGNGQVSFSGPALHWTRQVPVGGLNASCLDCFEVRRFLAAVDQPWSFQASYLGRSGSFQAYLTVVEMPKSAEVRPLNTFAEFKDCVTSFRGCP